MPPGAPVPGEDLRRHVVGVGGDAGDVLAHELALVGRLAVGGHALVGAAPAGALWASARNPAIESLGEPDRPGITMPA